MLGFFTFVLLIITFLAVIAEVYFVFSFVKSGFGKYPPFFRSFGGMKKACICEAQEILDQAQKNGKIFKVYDLGCGAGGLIVPLAKEFSSHKFCGVDWDILPYSLSKMFTRKLSNTQILRQDFTKINLQDADLILIFAGELLFKAWGDELFAGLKSGAIIISEAFEIPQLHAYKVIETNNYGLDLKVYCYKK